MDTHRVIVLTDPMPSDVAAEAARRSGGVTARRIVWGGAEGLGGTLPGDDLVIVTCRSDRVVEAVHSLIETGAGPIPALAIEGDASAPRLAASARALLADPGLTDLEIPVPAVDDDATRRRLWDQLRQLEAEVRHHLVEVDGGPAERWAAAAAAAAGVLAGRRAAGDRRWRADLG